jgi:hypothetical protein
LFGALASSGPLGLRCSLTTTEAITAACTKMATAAAIADRASVFPWAAGKKTPVEL